MGTGTSTGVPAIGCECNVCKSTDPHNKRLRASVLVTANDKNILIDTSPDLRQQALQYGFKRIDAVLYTHDHADHIHGIDELRSFNFLQWSAIPIYASKKVLERIKVSFMYIFEELLEGGGKPMITLHEIDGPFEAAGVKVIPLPVWHGSQMIFGYKIGDFAYISDVSKIPDETIAIIKNIKVVVLDALREKEHSTHMNIAQAVETAKLISAQRTIFTHMGHSVDHASTNANLPQGMELAYDGLEIIL